MVHSYACALVGAHGRLLKCLSERRVHAHGLLSHPHGLGGHALPREIAVDALRLLDERHAAALVAHQVAQVPVQILVTITKTA